jgi:hypothetical protein
MTKTKDEPNQENQGVAVFESGSISEGASFEMGFTKAAFTLERGMTRIDLHRITRDWRDLHF